MPKFQVVCSAGGKRGAERRSRVDALRRPVTLQTSTTRSLGAAERSGMSRLGAMAGGRTPGIVNSEGREERKEREG